MKMSKTKTFALAALTLCLCATALARQGDAGVRRVAVPGEKWAMEVSLPGFTVESDDVRGDGRGRRLMADDEAKGYVVSIFLEPVPHEETAAQLRDWDASNNKMSPLKPTDFKSGDYKEIPTLEYTLKEFRGQRINQKHFNAYIVRGGFWAHIHLSKMLFRPGDEKLFYTIVDSVKFVEGVQAADADAAHEVDDTTKLVGEGSAHFLRGEYAEAVGPYAKALESEKQSPRLHRDLWRVLVDNLTMSYGISGDLRRAKETAEYGISKDADYPMFYYLLANTYAESGDLDNTIFYLKQAFARRKNVIAGEHMPDPRTDDSFRRFMKDEKFLAALKEINP
jgi:tetratricopeptide (TPR) repeat protein